MKIEFNGSTENLHEAENVLRILHYLPMTASAEKLRGEVIRQVLDHIREHPDGDSKIRQLEQNRSTGLVRRLSALRRVLMGPSSGEIELSKQRHEALDRADRAERSSFEALAEMAAVGRERDALKKDLEVLRLRVKQLEDALPN